MTKAHAKRKDGLTAGAPNANNNHTQSQDTDYVSRKRAEEKRLLQEENTDRSPLDEGYWNGLGEHNRLNAKKYETGESEVVDITFARDSEQPPDIETSKDDNALESGSDSIAVWTGTVGLITMKEANKQGDGHI